MGEKFYSYVSQITSKFEVIGNDLSAHIGIYDLYANTEGHLILECNGSYWNGVKADNLPEGHWNTRKVAMYAKENGFSGVTFKNLKDSGDGSYVQPATVYIFFNPQSQVKSADPVTYDADGNIIPLSERFNPDNNDIRYSDRDLAPTFYSHMGKVVDGIKSEKVGAGGVVPYLKGKGVKNEEIKWSGIEEWLEGKRSVTKAELQEFIRGSQLQIREEKIEGSGRQEAWDDFYRHMESVIPYFSTEEIEDMCFDYDGDFSAEKFESELKAYVEDETISEDDFDEAIEYAQEMERDLNSSVTRWSKYKLDGGYNYRELLFKMPNSSYSNSAMKAHWGEDAEGVLAHARIQDFEVDGKKMLFIEEIQSDWHNEGAKKGYEETEARIEELKAKADEAFFKLEDYSTELTGLAGEWETVASTPKGLKLYNEYIDANAAYKEARDSFGKTPDAPFRSNYHEYVLKRLIRMAAEEGYDSIGWTTADIQSKRWSDNYAEGYRIEYDQDIPSFLKKYGKKWGATVGKTKLST